MITRTCGHTAGSPDPNCAHCRLVEQKNAWREANKTAGNSPEYAVWYRLVHREKQNVPKGWVDFDRFLYEVGKRPSKHHHLRRINRNKPYSKANVEWRQPIASVAAEGKTAYQRIWRAQSKN